MIAIVLVLQHKCDLINMSYGEPTLLPDYGRFVDIVDEVTIFHLAEAFIEKFSIVTLFWLIQIHIFIRKNIKIFSPKLVQVEKRTAHHHKTLIVQSGNFRL